MKVVPWLVALAMTATLVTTSRGGSLYDGDESVYGEFSREMRNTGDPFALRWAGHVVHQRPPGYVWALVLSETVLGEGEGPLRIPSALATALTALVVAALARRLAGGDPAAGACAAGGYASMAFTWDFGRAVESDPLLGLLCVAAVERFVAASMGSDESTRRRRLVAFGALLGGACMVKQVVGFLPLSVVFGWWYPKRERRELWFALAAFLAVWLPWHVVMTARYGGDFWSGYVGFNVIRRAAAPLLLSTPVTFYWDAFVRREGWPFSLSTAAVLLVCCVRAWRRKSLEDAIAVAPVLLGFFAFTVARSRVEYYLVAVTPFLAVLAARASRRPILVGVLGFALGLVSHGTPKLAQLDRAPQIRALAESASRSGARRIFVSGIEPSGTFYYSRLPTSRVILDRGTFDRLHGLDIFALPGALTRLGELPHGPADLLLAKQGPELDRLLASESVFLPPLAERWPYGLYRLR